MGCAKNKSNSELYKETKSGRKRKSLKVFYNLKGTA